MSTFKLQFITAAATLIAASATASGQTNLVANIPFEFKANRAMLPAGDYTVARFNSNLWVLEARASGHKTLLALGIPAISRAADRPQLVFLCRESHCALSQIQIGGGETGYELPKAKGGDGTEVARRIVPLSRASAE